MGPYTLIPGSPQALQLKATSGTGGILFLKGQSRNVTLYIEGDGTISTGTLILEEAYYDLNQGVYAGTWSQLPGSVPIDLTVLTGGAQQAVHIVDYSIWALRARIGTSVTGANGSISVWAWGN